MKRENNVKVVYILSNEIICLRIIKNTTTGNLYTAGCSCELMCYEAFRRTQSNL